MPEYRSWVKRQIVSVWDVQAGGTLSQKPTSVIVIVTLTFNLTSVIVIVILTLTFNLTSVIVIVIKFRHLAAPGQYVWHDFAIWRWSDTQTSATGLDATHAKRATRPMHTPAIPLQAAARLLTHLSCLLSQLCFQAAGGRIYKS